MNRFGFIRVTAVSPKVALANPVANALEVVRVVDELPDSDIVVFPELGLTGYTCADLFGQTTLLEAAIEGALRIAEKTRGRSGLVVVGLPLAVGNALYNCALAISEGKMLGVVPKQFLPNYKEFYERRWFTAANGREPSEIDLGGIRVAFGTDLLFEGGRNLTVGIEICEDLWMPIPPSSSQALAGATLLLNPSASNETVGKCRYRTDLIVGQSGRCIAGYVYAGAGPSESTTDVVFGGHCLIAENGVLLMESRRVGDGGPLVRGTQWITRDIDVDRLASERRTTSSFDDGWKRFPSYRTIPFAVANTMKGLLREVPASPFVPSNPKELRARCAEIFEIQCAGLSRRIEQLPAGTPLNIGISGGLDSTLALLVAVKACDSLDIPRTKIRGLTMPGFGTTQRTKSNALSLMEHLGVASETIDITPLALQTFRELGHKPFGIAVDGVDPSAFRDAIGRVPKEKRHDLTFENVQARLRTFLLMSRGFVIGTGDLSELALGWCTYNGDQMSMYNPNGSIPKTLVKSLVRYAAEHEFEPGTVRDTLFSVVETTISPELLPVSIAGEIEQSTEETIGPYELHDFFLYHAVRAGFSPEKILFLSGHAAFTRLYAQAEVKKTLRTFYKRFFTQQFKRSCMPDGPKVGSVSLSPRGDWRMPSDADPSAWLTLPDTQGHSG